MTEITSNDRAFIKISCEIRRISNDLEILKSISEVANRARSEYMGTLIRNIDDTRLCSPDIEKLLPGIKILGDQKDITIHLVESKTKRLTALHALSDQYMKGHDIVAAKLAQE